MKIIRDNVAYIQISDINYLINMGVDLPKTIYNKFVEAIKDDKMRYDFLAFTEKTAILYLKALFYVIDYDYIKKIETSKIHDMRQNLECTMTEILEDTQKLYDLEIDEQKKQKLCQYLRSQLATIGDWYWYRKGKITMQMPEGIEPPTEKSL